MGKGLYDVVLSIGISVMLPLTMEKMLCCCLYDTIETKGRSQKWIGNKIIIYQLYPSFIFLHSTSPTREIRKLYHKYIDTQYSGSICGKEDD